ncbi:MAG: hypothetical protein ABR543_11845 [Gemmatimonadaceae bacterium]
MVSKPISVGICALCGQQASKAKMLAHLAICIPAHTTTDISGKAVLFRFEAEGEPRYWIIMAARAKATLRQIDAVLRDLWLECCGHMSAFYVARHEITMRAVAGDVFRAGSAKVHYEYDFGSTTSLVGHFLDSRSGFAGGGPVRLLARNEPLHWLCAECAEPATVVCPYCVEADGLYCNRHAEAHEHAAEEAYLPVVNSPRMGVCGYTG